MSYFISNFYLQKVQTHLREANKTAIKEYIEAKKFESEFSLNQIMLLLYQANQKFKPKVELKEEVDKAYNIAHEIYDNNKKSKTTRALQASIKEALGKVTFASTNASLFIKDYSGNRLLKANVDSSNKEYRDIDLEAMQKVRRYKEGYIKYIGLSNEKKVSFVKNLDLYDWFIGSTLNLSAEKALLKSTLLRSIKSIPLDTEEFVGIIEKEKALYLTKQIEIDLKSLKKDAAWFKLKDSYYYAIYYEPLDWYIIYGFDAENMIDKMQKKQKEEEKSLQKEFSFLAIIHL